VMSMAPAITPAQRIARTPLSHSGVEAGRDAFTGGILSYVCSNGVGLSTHNVMAESSNFSQRNLDRIGPKKGRPAAAGPPYYACRLF
jgi:hypothetical protein